MVSCGGKSPEDDNTGNNDNGAVSLWKMKNYPVSKVEVFTGDDVPVETYEFTYDSFNRVLTLVRTDKIKGSKLLDLKYNYTSPTDMEIVGKYYFTSSNRTTKVSIDEDEGSVTYTGSWAGAWTFTTSFNARRTATGTTADVSYAATRGEYSSQGRYQEVYTLSQGDITTVETGTAIKSKAAKKTSVGTASTSAIMEITYSDKEDCQNFGVFLFNCEFPVWYAKELPGNQHLITGITWRNGDVPSHLSTRIEYKLTADGDIDTATRTDYNDSETVLVRKYIFTY